MMVHARNPLPPIGPITICARNGQTMMRTRMANTSPTAWPLPDDRRRNVLLTKMRQRSHATASNCTRAGMSRAENGTGLPASSSAMKAPSQEQQQPDYQRGRCRRPQEIFLRDCASVRSSAPFLLLYSPLHRDSLVPGVLPRHEALPAIPAPPVARVE